MIKPDVKPKVTLVGENGNAMVILGKADKALRKAGADEEYVKKYSLDATSSDYDHLLQVTMEYVDVN